MSFDSFQYSAIASAGSRLQPVDDVAGIILLNPTFQPFPLPAALQYTLYIIFSLHGINYKSGEIQDSSVDEKSFL